VLSRRGQKRTLIPLGPDRRTSTPVLLTPTSDTGTLVRGAGEALAWDPTPGEPWDNVTAYARDTLETPNAINVEASEQRMRAALDLGALQLALDAPAVRNRKRCRMHGGRSTGPRTAEGRERIRQAHLTHGFYSQAVKAERAAARQITRGARELMAKLDRWLS
jgi:hypothetical protein